MKTRIVLTTPISICLVFCLSLSLKAQIPSHLQADVNRVRRSHSINNSFPKHYYYGQAERLNRKFIFTVLFKDSTTSNVTSQIHFDTLTKKYYLLHENKNLPKSDSLRKVKIYADQTASVARFVTIDRIKIEGIATDSCWLFKVLSGKINAYSEYAEITGLDATYITAIQPEGGKIEPLVPERLEQLISTDEKALKFIKRKQYYAAIERFNRSND